MEVFINLWIIIWEYFRYQFTTVRLPSGVRTDFSDRTCPKSKTFELFCFCKTNSCFLISGHISGHHRKILNPGIGRIDTIFSRCEVVWRRIFHIGDFEIGTFDCKNFYLDVLLELFLWRFLHRHYLALKWSKLLWKKYSCYLFFLF